MPIRENGEVPSLPMRNWNEKILFRESPWIVFPAYLWGIETGSYAACAALYWRSQPTYEELKPIFGYVWFWSGGVPSLPMRNWNLVRHLGWSPTWQSSQPTYEELKQLMNIIAQDKVKGSQPTYEELKPNKRRFNNEENLRSQPTYEELKRIFQSSPLS